MQETTDTNTQSRGAGNRGPDGQLACIIESQAAFESFSGYLNARGIADRQRVFLVYRELFKGTNADVRKTKTILNIVLTRDDLKNVFSNLKLLFNGGNEVIRVSNSP
jgi:hypothetical protein